MKQLSTKYDPKEIEQKIYNMWDDAKLFHADGTSDKPPYCIVIPPPNVTGILHMGHALNNTIQDILVRWKRMMGYEALWVPGTDHAGIATQNVVERELAKSKLKRTDIGREKFLEKVWEWKESRGNIIIHQLKKLGCSCDWDRTRFTMDEGLSNAVKEAFIRLFEDNLIYKGDYIINWCPRCNTALSDEEAEHRDIDGMLYYIKYPVKGREKTEKEIEDYVIIATTRPETMLGDAAVAVNPKDERYTALKGKTLLLPILNRELKIIFDEDVDPEFGTGALKVTPAHDPVDFELGKKHNLENINVMHSDGRINELGGEYEGMDRFECRETIVEDLKRRKLFIKSEAHPHAVGHCYRCHTVVEPRLSKQWFVKMKPLAKEAVSVVKKDKIKFHPQRWTKVYLNWVENVRDWCISRQIWWGHRIPVWYCKDCLKYENVRDVEINGPGAKGVYIGRDMPDGCPECGSKKIEQDPDVLDTWFSSWLWPISTLGWPEKTKALEKFYPTDALVTAQEIIFFWVARMIMAGLKFNKQIPFKDVYIHGTVRDETGTKMSKSLGNVIDPIEVIDEVGSDALRFSLISITSQGQDVFLSKDKFEIGRNFANKLWNASRYVLMSVEDADLSAKPDKKEYTLADKWIISSYNETVRKVTKSLELFRFNDAATGLYEFIWNKYCAWYLEISKISKNKEVTQKILVEILRGALSLLHPFMPYITEEIWQTIPGKTSEWIMTAPWPVFREEDYFPEAMKDMDKIIGVITSARNIRAFWNIGHKTKINMYISAGNPDEERTIEQNIPYVEKFASCVVKEIAVDSQRPDQSVAALIGSDTRIYIPLKGAVNIEKERSRIDKKIEELERCLIGVEKKLDRESFLNKAPVEVVDKEKDKRERFLAQVRTLKDNLSALG